jgi:hypothetical protein
MTDEPLDRTKVSFAEAEGQPRYPAILKWGELDQRIRSGLWNAFYRTTAKLISEAGYGGYELDEPALSWFLSEHIDCRYRFADEFQYQFDSDGEFYERWKSLFSKGSYIDIFGTLTFLLRSDYCPEGFPENVAYAIDRPFSPYRLIIQSSTFVPVADEQQAQSLKANVAEIFNSRFFGAKTHLQAAFDALNRGDYRGVVRESIHAVESAARDVTGDPNAVLSRALNKLDRDHFHPALRGAFEKLYAYSSDEKGIRHALVFEENDNVGLPEALFFVSACASFIAYIKLKLPV